jgi:hypothetical protein
MRLRCYHDQTIAEMLTDSMTMMVMKADGIDVNELETALRAVAEAVTLEAVTAAGRCH